MYACHAVIATLSTLLQCCIVIVPQIKLIVVVLVAVACHAYVSENAVGLIRMRKQHGCTNQMKSIER